MLLSSWTCRHLPYPALLRTQVPSSNAVVIKVTGQDLLPLVVSCSFEAKEVGGRTQTWQNGNEVRLAWPASMQQAPICSCV